MNDLATIRQNLELTNEAMARLNQMLRDAPDSPGLVANMNTLRINHFKLEKEFEDVAKKMGVEICSYRLFPEGTERQSIVGIGKALLNFQSLFSSVYNAVEREESESRGGPTDETLLDFAYTFPGSVGVALTIPSQINLFGNYFYETVSMLSSMTKAQSINELKSFSARVGIGTMKTMYKWADDLTKAGFGVDIQWKGPRESYPRLYIQKPELASLKAVMKATSDETQEEFSKTGILQGIDIPTHSFHFEYKDETGKKRDIHGKFTDAVSSIKPVKVPSGYTVLIQKTTRVFYSTDEEEIKYLLIGIKKARLRGKAKRK